MTLISTPEMFQQEVLDYRGAVLVKFMATWCGPCKAQDKIIKMFEEKYPNRIKIVSVDIDDLSSITAKYYVSSIPSTLIFVNGKNVGRKVGLLSLSALEEFIKGYGI